MEKKTEFNEDYGMITYKGHFVDLKNGPTKEQIDIEDIAHHLANQCRYAGASSRFYSVAEHCVYVSMLAPKLFRPYYLLHDSQETWYQDMISPLKRLILKSSSVYNDLLDQCDKTVYDTLGFPYIKYKQLKEDIKKIDNYVYELERKKLFGNIPLGLPKDHPLYAAPFGLNPIEAEQLFLETFNTITK